MSRGDIYAHYARVLAIAGILLLISLVVTGCETTIIPEDQLSLLNLEYVRQFREVDSSGRGVITLGEAIAHYRYKFAELDTKRLGKLDAVALVPLLPIMQETTGEGLLRRLDSNGDGTVSLDEFLLVADWLFARARGPNNTMSLEDAKRAPVQPSPFGTLPSGKDSRKGASEL
jgi:hypothetical protein